MSDNTLTGTTACDLHDLVSVIANDEAFETACNLYRMGGGSPYSLAAAAIEIISAKGDVVRAASTARGGAIPYSSPEARTKAGETLDAGRKSVHAHPSKRQQAPRFPDIDELLFSVGQSRERMTVEIEAAHTLIPETLVPRNRGKTDERSIAARLRILLEIIDRRAAALLRPETDTPHPGDAA